MKTAPTLSPEAVTDVVDGVLAELAAGSMRRLFETAVADPVVEALLRHGASIAVRDTLAAVISPTVAIDRLSGRCPDDIHWGADLILAVEACLREWAELGRLRAPNDDQLVAMLDARGVRSVTHRPLKVQNLYRHLREARYDKRARFGHFRDLFEATRPPADQEALDHGAFLAASGISVVNGAPPPPIDPLERMASLQELLTKSRNHAEPVAEATAEGG